MKRFDRTWLAVVILLLAALVILQPGWIMSILNIVQSIVLIVLGIVATIYLWKRL